MKLSITQLAVQLSHNSAEIGKRNIFVCSKTSNGTNIGPMKVSLGRTNLLCSPTESLCVMLYFMPEFCLLLCARHWLQHFGTLEFHSDTLTHAHALSLSHAHTHTHTHTHFNVSLIVRDKVTRLVSADHSIWREDSNRGPSAYQPNALPLGQTGSLCR